MAGTYPDVPGHRFMYDQDGSLLQATSVNTTSVTPYTPVDATLINDEDSEGLQYGSATGHYREFVVSFPEPRDISGSFIQLNNSGGSGATSGWYSLDTTDGTDGSWTPFTLEHISGSLLPAMRTSIQNLALTGVRGIRLRVNKTSTGSAFVAVWHLYGSISVLSNPERLEFWQPTADSMLDKAGLDFGDMPIGSVKTKTFRIKNLSTTKTANSTVVSANNLAGGDNTAMVTGMEFSLDGGSWSPSVTLPSLAPGAISAVVSARRTVGLAEAVTAHVARVTAVPTTFIA